MVIYKKVRTPCIGVCSTGIGDNVCRGCKRFAHEVIDWNAYSEEQRRIIAERRDGYLANAVRSQLEIVDQNLLLTQMRHQQIRFNEDQNPYCWVFELLRAGASQIDNLAHYGLAAVGAAHGVALTEVKRRIDDDFYALSVAYYQRFVAPGLQSA
ncbi:DUF1289 domain-containing protein [Microbulbifer harenosus]|uniref:DUF1289 domain-containing protein n=1 Tax=Microbulbifer harenosus TaxID=2576840 RepID=A0ABY2UKA4_9GAMM|nr:MULTISPECIES: DUF1289 domain-containing protein [Microbulbifer]QIL89381.1 DUF1289 domain-containing protein [Microbulbifer sp. SH-1]TLM78683.1 DUF1289 domain-containing protein [Microbulbifer harenosus]